MQSTSAPDQGEFNDNQYRVISAWRISTLQQWEKTFGVTDEASLDDTLTKLITNRNINDLLSRLEAFYDLHLDFPVEEEIVLRRLKYWSESQSGESFQAMIRQFYQDIWREDGSEAIQAVIFAFLREVDRLAVVSAPTTPRRVQSSRRLSFEIDAQLRPHWAQPLIGPSLNLLRDTIRKYEAQYNPDRHYSKAVSFVQASGMGKSRLADELGLYTSIVTFVLRADFENGFPRPDRAIRDFLLSNTEQDG